MQGTDIWLVFSMVTIVYCHLLQRCHGNSTYDDVVALMNDILGSNSSYNPDVLPRNNYNTPIRVNISLALRSLIDIDDVGQSIKINGDLCISWIDEKIRWNGTKHGKIRFITPKHTDVWRPRLVLANALGDRNVFEGDYSPFLVLPKGLAVWCPANQFEASCALDMMRYPFDKQMCSFTFGRLNPINVAFYKTAVTLPGRYIPNEMWDVLKMEAHTELGKKNTVKYVHFQLTAKRRPNFFIVNMIVPIVMLSFLNNFVFLIPDEAGEKIQYGITVLLALAVFLSTISSMIPRASGTIPSITIYIFSLMFCSCVSVITSIGTVFLYHGDESETAYLQAQHNFRRAVKKFERATRSFRRTRYVEGSDIFHDRTDASGGDTALDDSRPEMSKYRVFVKRVNKFCFAVSLALWVIINVTYIVYVNL